MKKRFYLFSLLILPLSAAFAQTNTWTSVASMTISRGDHEATLLPSGSLWVTGGFDANALAYNSTEVYTPATDSWTIASPMSSNLAAHTATKLPDGRILLVGGLSIFDTPAFSSVELFDPVNNSWSPAAPLKTGRARHTATLLPNGKVLVTGGSTLGIFSNAIETTELYDPATNSWSDVAPMGEVRCGHKAVLLPSGKVFVVGGRNSTTDASRYLVTTELYDPLTNSWSPGIILPTPLTGSKSLLLPNGNVLLIGGYDGVNVLSTCHLYDPSTNSLAPAIPLPAGRLIHTATLLPSGNVLVTGGASTNTYTSVTNSVLLFDIAPSLTMGSLSSTTLCGGQSLTLTATTSYSLGPYSYTITDGTTPAISGTASGTAFSQSFIPTGSGAKNYTLTIETDYARVSAVAPPVLVYPVATIGTISVSGPASCTSPARLTAPVIGSSFVFTGPGGYVFSHVYRTPGTYNAFAEGVKLGVPIP